MNGEPTRSTQPEIVYCAGAHAGPRYEWIPGAINLVRVWIRKRTVFSRYRRWAAPIIGWPRIRRIT